MKKTYTKPEINVTVISNSDVITLSSLSFGGGQGNSEKGSFNELFGD